MRIGFFTDSYLPRLDGIAISVESFRKHLEELGHEVYVFCPKRPGEFTEVSKRIYRFNSTPAFIYDEYRHTFPFAPKHLTFIKKLNLDIIHVHTSPLQVALLGHIAARRYNIPLVSTAHSDPGLLNDYGWLRAVFSFGANTTLMFAPKPRQRPHIVAFRGQNELLKQYFDQFDRIIAPSAKIRGSIQELGVSAQIEIIPTGVDLKQMPPSTARQSQRKALGLKPTDIAFVSTSRHVKEKRIDFLVRAFAVASQNMSNCVFLIIGDGPMKSRVERLANKLGVTSKIKFMGRLEHKTLLETLAAADVLVNGSLRETQGLVFNEAAMVGLPVIALEADINPIIQHEKTGLITDDNLFNFSQAMIRLATDDRLRQRLGKHARELAKAHSAAIEAKKLIKLYKQLV